MKQELIDKVYSLINKHYADNYHEKRSDFCYELSKIIVASLKLDEGMTEAMLLKEMQLKCDSTSDSQDSEISKMLAQAICANPADVITVEDMFDGYGN